MPPQRCTNRATRAAQQHRGIALRNLTPELSRPCAPPSSSAAPRRRGAASIGPLVASRLLLNVHRFGCRRAGAAQALWSVPRGPWRRGGAYCRCGRPAAPWKCSSMLQGRSGFGQSGCCCCRRSRRRRHRFRNGLLDLLARLQPCATMQAAAKRVTMSTASRHSWPKVRHVSSCIACSCRRRRRLPLPLPPLLCPGQRSHVRFTLLSALARGCPAVHHDSTRAMERARRLIASKPAYYMQTVSGGRR